MRFSNAQDAFSNLDLFCGNVAKLFPVVKPATSDDVVDRGKCPVGVIQVTVQHAGRL